MRFGAGNEERSVREYTVGEEIANSITHGVGALLAIAAIPITIVKAVSDGGGILLFCALMYTIFMLFEYVASTLYHALTPEPAKRVFKVLDHSFIYLFIAASYTPYCLVTLADIGGWPLFFIVWGVAIAGVAAEAFWVFRPRWVNAVLYLLLGWAVVWFIPALHALLPATGFWLLVAGGVCYSIGCVFYILKQVPYFHTVFHVFILAGSILQYFSILLFVL
jgi:hemolysin III